MKDEKAETVCVFLAMTKEREPASGIAKTLAV
jgi:hypothetical protein